MTRLLRIALAISFLVALTASAAEPLTFFGWSDQHVTAAGDAKHLVPAIEAMNTLAGTPYPAEIGGTVVRPAFVFGCGDISEWPSAAARDAYAKAIEQLKFPAYDLVGNHDEGGKVPSDTIKNWIISRHKALSYTFDASGIHFLAVFSEYNENLDNPAQAVSPKALEFIRTDLSRLPKDQPAIVALHLCFDAITNRDALIDAFGRANVLLVLGGHYHKSTMHEFRGYRFVQLPSPQSTTTFTVLRIDDDRILALPYDYKAKKWVENPRIRLDAPIKRSGAAVPPAPVAR